MLITINGNPLTSEHNGLPPSREDAEFIDRLIEGFGNWDNWCDIAEVLGPGQDTEGGLDVVLAKLYRLHAAGYLAARGVAFVYRHIWVVPPKRVALTERNAEDRMYRGVRREGRDDEPDGSERND